MDNPSRSERTRNACLEAALTIISRDGPGRMTLDAIAREAGVSKGGLMHQFPSKHAVLKALLDRQVDHFHAYSRERKEELGDSVAQPELIAQILTLREAAIKKDPTVFAILGALVEDPSLLTTNGKRDTDTLDIIRTEADDPQLSMIRQSAAYGLALTALFGMSSFTEEEQGSLFERLLDNEAWEPFKRSSKTL